MHVARENQPEVAQLFALSIREAQVVSYVALGHSHKLIAYTLGLSISTVASHVKRACKKLGVSSRVELVRTLSPILSPFAARTSNADPNHR